MSTQTLHKAVTQKALKTKPPKHMRTRGNGKKGQVFNEERLIAACKKYGVDPVEVAAKALSRDVELTDKERTDVALRLMKYLMPEKRAVEHSGEVTERHVFAVPVEADTAEAWERLSSGRLN